MKFNEAVQSGLLTAPVVLGRIITMFQEPILPSGKPPIFTMVQSFTADMAIHNVIGDAFGEPPGSPFITAVESAGAK